MALVEAALASDLLSIFKAMKDAPMTEEVYAAKLAKAFNDHIKTATVTISSGITVTTPLGPGSTSAPGTGTLS